MERKEGEVAGKWGRKESLLWNAISRIPQDLAPNW